MVDSDTKSDAVYNSHEMVSQSILPGLTSGEARARLREVGPNEPAAVQATTALSEILRQFANPLIAILLIAGVVSGAIGQWVNATIIVAMVFLGIVINFVQTYQSRKVVESLRRSVAPTATVLRDGGWKEIPRREVVPGDCIRLVPGDLVPADGHIAECEHLHVQESALTGESIPAEKQTADLVFLGTSVVSGTATAVVTATGRITSFGAIAERLATRRPDTEFDRGTYQFGLFIMKTVVFLVLFVFLVNSALKRDPFESLLFAIALAVGLTPEFLPMISSVTLAHGAVYMARKKVIVKNLASMQNFGSIDVLCSDKTGTLTSGLLTLDRHVDPFGAASESAFQYAYLNSTLQSGISNPVDESLQRAAANPLDAAIMSHDHPDTHSYRKVVEIPFDFERRLVSVVARTDNASVLITKGAPESVLARCTGYEANGTQYPMDDAARSRSETTYRTFCTNGFRVLAVAYRQIDARPKYDSQDESSLVLAGFLTFIDPPLEEAATAIQSLHRDGIRVKILTGDNAQVTRYICSQVGLRVDRIVEGADLERLTDAAVAHLAEHTVAFARVSPAQKNRIILALKARKHAVGYLGDGINDAPSLHSADVGISVSTAVDVARDAADIILLERSLKVLHEGIIEGRKAFGNVMKYLLMGTSSNFGNMLSMAAASVFLPFLPMLPTQILLNNFLYDLAQITIPTDNVDPGLIRKPRHWDIKLIRKFMIYIGPISSIYDFLTFYTLLVVFKAQEALFHTGWFVESLATQTLVLFVIRTTGNPLRSRPSTALMLTTLGTVFAGVVLPFTTLASTLGFVPLPPSYFAFLAAAILSYLLLVEIVKRHLLRIKANTHRVPL